MSILICVCDIQVVNCGPCCWYDVNNYMYLLCFCFRLNFCLSILSFFFSELTVITYSKLFERQKGEHCVYSVAIYSTVTFLYMHQS